MTLKQIDKAVEFWKPLLKLEAWTIVVSVLPKSKMVHDGEETEGHIVMHLEERFANIELRRGASESTLVHELLHIVHDGDTGIGEYNILHERALNTVAEAMMFLKK